ncbi:MULTISPECIES: UvrD-helicase domain-containing protein [unclassified Moritella]|uniref:UvrD-helicase domain-containing protein n=1 Tax=unclassified Moritella TaxID=2637987 RepID=UPI001BA4A65E|nr:MULTISPECIES: UvrD-helicase domain-containing protein [unclassified Moritella]QUM81490.1 UvrD-helicase domain-containing protein [Moritella sp. 5]QUM85802.1 UvrD-helicase domain-containing protein [Moritella sp. 28]
MIVLCFLYYFLSSSSALPDYSFSTFAQLFGANCRTLSFCPEGAVFTTKRQQTYHYPWTTFEPKLKHFRGSFFDTLVLNWESQRVRLNGIDKAEVTGLIDELYFRALEGKEAEILELYQQLTQVIEQGYISHSKWLALQTWLLPWADWFEILPQINKIPAALKLPLAHLRFWQQSQVENLDKYNQAVMNKQKQNYKTLFDRLETHPLTEKQRDACIVANDANLVLAGAGCGKTSVMLGRCAYLLESQQATADTILILAFAKDAAQEMKIRLKERLPNARITVKTFHALALDIIKQVETNKPKISKLASSDNAKQQFFKQAIATLLMDAGFNALFSEYCYAYVAWLGKLPSEKHEQEVTRLLAGKGGYKKLLTQLVELTMQYKNTRTERAEKRLSALPDSDFAALTHEVVVILLEHYQTNLAENNEIDFDEMITKASDYVSNGQFSSPWLHILVDEFQDISQARASLVRLLQTQHDDSKLFCVGDDWQAIYQFAGSDIAVTTRFSDYFGMTSTLPLDTTFRFNDQISAVASGFVMVNTEQMNKKITTYSKAKKACIQVNYYQVSDNKRSENKKNDDAARLLLEKKLKQIAASVKGEGKQKSVLLLARFNFQLPDNKTLTVLSTQYPQLAIKAMTVHSSKGQEADNVVVLAMEAGEHGFPCHKSRHPFAMILQPDVSGFPDAEERRLFYVALTRARQQVYLLCNKSNPSSFVEELVTGDYAVTIAK